MKNILKNYYGFIVGFLLVSSVALGAKYYGTGIFDAVGIGSTQNPHASNVLDVRSTTKSSRPCPAMTEAQRDAISSPQSGNCVFNTTTNKLNYYEASSWEEVGSGGGGTGDVIGPASSTQDAIARYDDLTGKLLADSSVTISDAGIMSGATQFNVDNLRLDGNTLSSTNSNGNVVIAPNGTGNVVTDRIQTSGSSGIGLYNSGGTLVAEFGASNTTNSTIIGVTNIDDLQINANSILSTGTNANIVLDPNGTGFIAAESAIRIPEIATPATPASGFGKIYFKTDGNLYQLDDAGVETLLAGGGGGAVDSVNGQTGVVVLDLDDINDVALSSPTSGDYLTFNGTNWINSVLDLSTYVEGPATSTLDAIARYDDTTGKLLADSSVTISDAGVMSGATQLNVDNLRLDGQVLSSTNSNGNVEITPNGSGLSVVKNLSYSGTVNQSSTSIDAVTTGAAATLTTPTNYSTEVTNASLESITGITAPTTTQHFILYNNTGRAITLLNEQGTSANQIVTGTGSDLIFPNGSSVSLYYRNSKWGVLNNINNASTTLVQTFTTAPTINNFGTTTANDWKFTVIGNMLHAVGGFTTGTAAAAAAGIVLPNGWTHDSTTTKIVGRWWYNRAVGSSRKTGTLFIASNGTTVQFGNDDYTTAVSPITAINADTVSGSTQVMWVEFRLPITQLSQNTTQGLVNQANLYKLSASRTGGAQGISSSSETTLIYDTVLLGPASDFNTSTGTWTVPKSGYYNIRANPIISGVTATETLVIRIIVNGSTTAQSNVTQSIGSASYPVNKFNLYLTAGQTVTITSDSQSDTSYSFENSTSFDIQEVPFSNTAISNNFTYYSSARNSNNQAVTSGNAIVFNTAIENSHGVINTSTGVITFPVKGIWEVSVEALTQSVAASVGNFFGLNIRDLTNSTSRTHMRDYCQDTTSRAYVATASRVFKANAGDTAEVRFNESIPAVNLDNDSSANILVVRKIGDW